MKKLIYILIAVLLIGAAAYTLRNNKQKMATAAAVAEVKSEAIPVVLTEPKLEQIDRSFTAQGNFEPVQSLTLLSETTGQVLKLNKRKGDRVQAGEVLAQVENNTLRADLITSQANYDKAKRDLGRYENLAAGDAITKKQLEEARLGVQQAEANLIMAKQRMAKSTIKAPITGSVNQLFIEVGSYLSPGTKLFEIVNVDKLKLNVKVTETEVLLVKEGAKVKLKADANPTEDFEGTVTAIGATADNSLKYDVEIEVKNFDKNSLKAGMYGTALFAVPNTREALLIPRESIVGSLQEPKIYVVQNNTAHLKSITTGTVTQEKVEVLTGLTPGEKVVRSGQINLKEGIKVTELK
ncbi:MAG: efflux RND transporter periplasmic adaptor subunit [Sphingobacteriales bacterium]|nr:MAG: efflux RND transporter periplasmic adaptor subunit [Sphingobacteriales bacterium]